MNGSMTDRDLNGKWIDFYALLGLSEDADKETLRKTIGASYADASANADHRDLQRRHYFQTMVERVLPQCRRVLLDPDLRAAYDDQNARHRAGDESALDYVTFMAALQSGNLAALTNAGVGSTEWDDLPEKVREEIDLARSVLECVEAGSEFDIIPARTVTSSGPINETTAPPIPTPEIITPTPIAASTPAAAAPISTAPISTVPIPTDTPATSATDTQSTLQGAVADLVASDGVAMPAAPQPAVPRPAAPGTASDKAEQPVTVGSGPTIRERYEAAASAAIADTGSFTSSGPKPKPKAQPYKSRLSIDDDEEPRESPSKRVTSSRGKRGKTVLTPLATHILVTIVSAMLVATIFQLTDDPAPAANRLPLTVVYASELRPIMEMSEQQFESSADGAGIDVILQATDSREGMSRLLASGVQQPDVWIPSEAMWSNRYNQVASQKGRRSIASSNPLALSPLVLVARSDRAATLRAKFPDRVIDSWSALRAQVLINCAKRFGMTDPQRSGDGALVRYSMTREWCEQNKVPWNRAAANPALWKWLSGFEENVSGYSSTDAMVKDMALGTTGRYWWCLAYESQAIDWMKRGKNLDVFYLPGTYYADHPFCHIERAGASREIGIARNRFEKFLHSEPVQTSMLQSGFRPNEIDLQTAVEGNPFKTKALADRGVRARGFEVGAKLDYRTINNLTAQWAQRYTS